MPASNFIKGLFFKFVRKCDSKALELYCHVEATARVEYILSENHSRTQFFTGFEIPATFSVAT